VAILTVTVRNTAGNSITNASISLSRNNNTLKGLTGSEPQARKIDMIAMDTSGPGSCTFDNLTLGRYMITVEASGYTTQVQTINIIAATTYTVPFIMLGDLGLVPLPAGTFTMGDTVGYWSTNGYTNEIPLTNVTLSSFYIGKYDVTNTEYCAFLNSQGNLTEGGYLWIEATNPGIAGTGPFTVVSGYENHPVVEVSWYGAVAYCNWLSDLEGLTKCYGDYTLDGSGRWGVNGANFHRANNGYRLPTNAEWEYACRANSTTDYFWGENYDPIVPGSPLLISNYCWWSGNCIDMKAVGLLLPNGFGLYDMNGNVWQWCNDYNHTYSGGNEINPIGPTTAPPVPGRICRGGGFYGNPNYSRSSSRASNLPAGGAVIGFRIVRTN
jgi:formylglycine-generating enzyme required for sulfatase activity